ncbi:MAG TPA: TrpB-like pyridoxal phosphate-dependent enzyme [Candidatus Aminicenantes bacterium]|nr:TrpB-like pyridoxal phosphate-dependent enzyme [Candidatus Aminicenantes bacterium]
MERFLSRHEKHLPNHFYNLKADLETLPPPPLSPVTHGPLDPQELLPIFPAGLVAHEVSRARSVPIPPAVLAIMAQYRPTPLVYASELRRRLGTPAHIFYKYEGVSPSGSHKSNTALVQAHLAAAEGVETLVTETGADQWGSALALAGQALGLRIHVYMVGSSFHQKPERRALMEMAGAEVTASPSGRTRAGRACLGEGPDHPGSLGIAIAEAVEEAVGTSGAKYALGSVLDSVLLHQSVIGLEARSQLAEVGASPDLVVGCVGGGSNFAGLAFPLLHDPLGRQAKCEFLAVEPAACPTLTRGRLGYDHGDSAGLTPLLFMHSLGKGFVPPPLHAGGLRYHGMSPLVSHLVAQGRVKAVALEQDRVFAAARLFLSCEGILPAPESAHAIAAVIDEALRCRETGEARTILLGLSGHGLLDLASYRASGGAGS